MCCWQPGRAVDHGRDFELPKTRHQPRIRIRRLERLPQICPMFISTEVSDKGIPSSGDRYHITLCAAWLAHMAATTLGANPGCQRQSRLYNELQSSPVWPCPCSRGRVGNLGTRPFYYLVAWSVTRSEGSAIQVIECCSSTRVYFGFCCARFVSGTAKHWLVL